MISHRPLKIAVAFVVLGWSAGLCGQRGSGRTAELGPGITVESALSIADCFKLARDNNATLKRAVAAVQETRYEAIIARSRLLPQVSLLFAGAAQGVVDTVIGNEEKLARTTDQSLDLQVRQRVLEFGPTKEQELNRIRDRDRSLYGKEDELVRVLSGVRSVYFSLQIMDEQLGKHDSLIAMYKEKLAKAQERLTNGVGVKSAVLTADLNRLEEKQRILQLNTRRRQSLVRLKELLGVAAIKETVTFPSEIKHLSLSEDSCVALGMANNTDVALARLETELARRRLYETGWQFAPEMSLSAGAGTGHVSAQMELSTNRDDSQHKWNLDAVGAKAVTEPDGNLVSIDNDPKLRYTARLTLEFPIFQGMRRAGEVGQALAQYTQARETLIAKTRELERRLRESYYNHQLSMEQLSIEGERVVIARERYALAEAQYELARITEDGYDSFREQLFGAQDRFFAQQFSAMDAEEELRALVRVLE
jgi:outer membrane protein TolC